MEDGKELSQEKEIKEGEGVPNRSINPEASKQKNCAERIFKNNNQSLNNTTILTEE
jgi:hypothetical protein